MTTLSGSQIDRSQALIDEIRAGCAEEEKHIFAAAKAEVETIVVCTGQEPQRELLDGLEAAGVSVSVIGGADVAAELDAKRAIKQGTEVAASL